MNPTVFQVNNLQIMTLSTFHGVPTIDKDVQECIGCLWIVRFLGSERLIITIPPSPSLSERARHWRIPHRQAFPVQIADQKEPIQQPIVGHCRRHHFDHRVLGQCHSLWIYSRWCPCLRVLVMKLQKCRHFTVMMNDQILDPQCGETLGNGTPRYPMTALLRKKCVLRGHFERP